MSTEGIIVTLTFACCAVAHFVGLCVMGILAYHRVQYLSLAWVLAIFFGVLSIVSVFGEEVATGSPGILNPYMLLMLVVGTYLQSIYALGIAMPGYLQWGRMIKYASPIVILALLYAVAMYPVGLLTKVFSLAELFDKALSLELVLRFFAFLLGLAYVLNIVFLPKQLAYKSNIPALLVAYTVVLILSVILYLYTALNYTPLLLCAYIVLFTVVNFFWVCHSMEGIIQRIPLPEITLLSAEDRVLKAEATLSIEEDKRQRDFNEQNQKRYARVQLWMQQNKSEWMCNGFTRDRLCELTGINRQLMLQCLRSQGHNNVHEYITAYRVAELKRLFARGEIVSLSDCEVVGFGSVKTAKLCFERIEGYSLEEFLQSKAKPGCSVV